MTQTTVENRRPQGMKITEDSHMDHALGETHKAFLLARFGDRTEFFIETVVLPGPLASLPCGLHGPVMGDEPVPDAECSSEVRGNRKGPSRMCDRPVRLVRTLTVIGGPHKDEPCILYTAFGGPSTPREPWDETLSTEAQKQEARAFWAQHALSR